MKLKETTKSKSKYFLTKSIWRDFLPETLRFITEPAFNAMLWRSDIIDLGGVFQGHVTVLDELVHDFMSDSNMLDKTIPIQSDMAA